MHLNVLHRTPSDAVYSIFKRQQDLAHSFNLKTTVFVSYSDLFNEEVVKDAFQYEREFGDEIGLSIHALNGPGVSKIARTQNCIWLLNASAKREVLDIILRKFREICGRPPVSVGSYHFDSSALRILKELEPGVETVIGGCFEEGVRVFHGCNHSWYLFNEGMPWNPWYPSQSHSLRPAADEKDSSGIVAVPHLMRDMTLSYEGRNDFWASHPPNVIRGMGNDASFCPYDLNLVDQFRMQEEWNDGYSYYNTFVSASWLTWNHNSEYPPEVAWELYTKQLRYLGELKKSGEVHDSTLAEYGRWHRAYRPVGQPEVYWAKEMLYGSHKHYFWFIDPSRRILIDATQGGAVGDLRPYAGRVPVATGPDTANREIASYPFLIQSQHRSGNAHHCQDGARTTLLLSNGKAELDSSFLRSKIAAVTNTAGEASVTLTPAKFQFANGLKGELTTRHIFLPQGQIKTERTISNLSDPQAELTLTEYFKGAPGRTEYPEDMHGIRLGIDGNPKRQMEFDYSGEAFESVAATMVYAEVPQTRTRIELATVAGEAKSGAVKAGHLFSPYFTLFLTQSLKGNGKIITWTNLKNIEP